MTTLLPTATTTEERDRNAQVAILPVGSFEQHGDHLPLSTDTIVATLIARQIADAHPVLLLPPVTISCSHEHSAWPGTVSISARTLHAIITDVYDSVTRSGPTALVVVNGHGGNYVLSNVVQEANAEGRRMALFPSREDWNEARAAAHLISSMHEDMHAGELETSLLLHACPEVIRPAYQSADWLADDRRHLLTKGMQAYTDNGVIGRPSLATAEKGKALLDSLTTGFSDVLDLFAKS
ncbi:creatininase family protein [Streptosporangium sp. NPDC023963]|uniref:creatininase family protein n=1 Tax=Streptosporangium sp. NPDC023963 TaxID=3155608 RepID=UPI00342C3012